MNALLMWLCSRKLSRQNHWTRGQGSNVSLQGALSADGTQAEIGAESGVGGVTSTSSRFDY